MIRSSEVKSVKKPTVEGSVNKLSMTNGAPSVVVKKISPSDVVAKQEKSKMVVPGLAKKPIIIVEGTRMDPVIIKPVIQLPVINTKAIPWNYERAIVTYKGKEVKKEVNEVQGLTRSGRCFASKKLRKAKISRDNPVLVKKTVTEEEAEEFLRKMKAEDDKGPWVYQVFETVLVEKVLEGKCVPTSKIASASVMVASEMLKNGFVPGKGLGASLQDIIQLVSLPKNLDTFSLRFKSTTADVKRARRLKQKAWALPKPISRLSRYFVKLSARKRPVMIISSSVVDVDEELIERFQRLFDNVNMVEVGEGSSIVDVQFIGPNVKLNNWKATPLPTRKESWEEIIKALFEYKDIFAWSYDDMPVLSTDLVVHKFSIDPAFHPVKQKLRKFKTDMSVKIKEEVTKQLNAKRLRRYNFKLNPTNCAFGVPSGKLLGFIVSRRGIELDPSKIKAIQELPPPKNKTKVMSLLGRLNYISRFIAQLTTTYEPIFKLLKKDVVVKWTDECQETFDKIKEYLSNPPVLVPPEPGRPLILYLTVLDNSFGCVLGQHDITGKKEKDIYYLIKKFISYEVKYTPLERTCCALTWVA
ncbi:uncharacterized protein [Nicotiana sylvestris]|uniref:uncharacterized protein n=1 Tax=Nicotiana sylvestris TaxID=4096 RepID=UPI00388C6CAB